jgi:dUTP pyrophosphatase
MTWEEMRLRVAKMNARATCPTRGSKEAAGFDLYSDSEGVIPARTRGLISTGIKVAIPSGYYGQVAARSGLALKKGIMCMAGVVDSDYRGELKVLLHNSGEEDFSYERGDRVAQMILIKISECGIEEVCSLEATERAEQGFGSTGNK